MSNNVTDGRILGNLPPGCKHSDIDGPSPEPRENKDYSVRVTLTYVDDVRAPSQESADALAILKASSICIDADVEFIDAEIVRGCDDA